MYSKLREFFRSGKYGLSFAVLSSFYINISFLSYRKQELKWATPLCFQRMLVPGTAPHEPVALTCPHCHARCWHSWTRAIPPLPHSTSFHNPLYKLETCFIKLLFPHFYLSAPVIQETTSTYFFHLLVPPGRWQPAQSSLACKNHGLHLEFCHSYVSEEERQG